MSNALFIANMRFPYNRKLCSLCHTIAYDKADATQHMGIAYIKKENLTSAVRLSFSFGSEFYIIYEALFP